MTSHTPVLLFPGQGSQSAGMGADIFDHFSEFRLTLEEASDTLGFDMQELCFHDSEKKLNLTEFTQPAILTISTALFRILSHHAGLKPEVVAGHSLGEYSALVALGALKFADALKAVRFRGAAMQRAVPIGTGAMAAYIGTACDKIPQICANISKASSLVEVVNYNSRSQLVLSGHKDAVESACQLISTQKLGKAIPLPVSAPFHSSLMKPAAMEMEEFLEKITLHPFSGKIVANYDATLHSHETYTRGILVKQIASPVLWTQSLEKIRETADEGAWIEVGPGKVLRGLATKTIDSAVCHSTHDYLSLKSVLDDFKG